MTGPAVSPRIAPGDRRSIGTIAWVIARLGGVVTGTTPPNLFLVLGRNRRLFRGWLHFASRLMPGGSLPRRETELVILRVAQLTGCIYELEHHRRLADRAGLGPADVERVADGPEVEGWTERERILLTVTDELHTQGDLSDETWDALVGSVDPTVAIEVVMLVAHYEMLATIITTLRIPLDEPRRRHG